MTDVAETVRASNSTFEQVMRMFQDRLQQYKYMEVSKKQQMADLKTKIPDIEKNLDTIRFIRKSKELMSDIEDEPGKTLTTNFELNDTLYAEATIDIENLNSVYLWLGADVMLEYPLDEAVQLLQDRLEKNQKHLQLVKEDLEFLKENITTMEVNTARLFNWDVEQRKKEKVES